MATQKTIWLDSEGDEHETQESAEARDAFLAEVKHYNDFVETHAKAAKDFVETRSKWHPRYHKSIVDLLVAWELNQAGLADPAQPELPLEEVA